MKKVMTEIKKMYISLPITGQEDTIEKRYDEILDYCEIHYPEYDLIFPPDISDAYNNIPQTESHNYAWYMGKDLIIISECDAILMTKGWKDSLGCRVEHDIAERTGLEIMYMEN